jgi:hypothetical protein
VTRKLTSSCRKTLVNMEEARPPRTLNPMQSYRADLTVLFNVDDILRTFGTLQSRSARFVNLKVIRLSISVHFTRQTYVFRVASTFFQLASSRKVGR